MLTEWRRAHPRRFGPKPPWKRPAIARGGALNAVWGFGPMRRLEPLAESSLRRRREDLVQIRASLDDRHGLGHSVVTAIIAQEAARLARLDSEVAYTTGLLHNLGTLGLMSAYPDEYSRMLEVSNDFGFDLLQTERDLFEIDHCAAGAYLA